MKKIAIAALLSVVTFPVVAEDMHMYIGARAGQARTNLDNVVLDKDTPTAWGVSIGHAFNPMFAIEAEYLNLGKVTAGVTGLESRGYSLSGVGSIPLGEQFSFFGKLGYAMISTKVNSNVPYPDSDSDALTYGLGGQFNFSPTFGLRVGWDRYNIDDSAVSLKGNISLVSAGAVIKF